MKIDISKLDLSGVISGHPSAKHLSGVLTRVKGRDVGVTARHLGAREDQQVMLGGLVFTIKSVKGVSVGVTSGKPSDNWETDRLFDGDLAIIEFKEVVPPHITRYELSPTLAGTGHMLHASGVISTFPFQRHTSFNHWMRGSFLRTLQFKDGDSGRPILVFDKKTGKTLLLGVLSRQWWGEWLRLYRTISAWSP